MRPKWVILYPFFHRCILVHENIGSQTHRSLFYAAIQVLQNDHEFSSSWPISRSKILVKGPLELLHSREQWAAYNFSTRPGNGSEYDDERDEIIPECLPEPGGIAHLFFCHTISQCNE